MVFVWFWSVVQLSLMGRCVNAEPLSLMNIRVFEDHIQVKYNSNKYDQAGVKVSMKNIYANPLNPFIFIFCLLQYTSVLMEKGLKSQNMCLRK